MLSRETIQFCRLFVNKKELDFLVVKLYGKLRPRYVVQVSKHHEGFTSWPSAYSFNWNAKAVGPNRDLVEELSTAIRKKTSIHYGMYHSMFEWFNPLFLKDKANNYTTDDFVTVSSLPVKDTVVVNDRWGAGCVCRHGGYLTCKDRYNPKTVQKFKWEGGLTIDQHTWGYVRNSPLSSYLTIEDIITRLVQVVSCGGNLLINVGPTKEGTITPIYEERLRQMGSWLAVNGEAIYKTSPWRHQNDTVNPDVWYTTHKDSPSTVYALVLKWPSGQLTLGCPVPSSHTEVTLLGYRGPAFFWSMRKTGGMEVDVPPLSPTHIPCQWAWAFKITKVG